MKNFLLLILFFSFSVPVMGHHYKGLPHYGYFDNYPQVPNLEFIKETPEYEVFVTVYNFQGLNLDKVESPKDVRLYIYIYDLEQDEIFKRPASFEVYSHAALVYNSGLTDSEQENIFVLQAKIEQQDDLVLRISFKDAHNKPVRLELPFQITETLFQRFGLALMILAFFAAVILMKITINRRNDRNGVKPQRVNPAFRGVPDEA